MDTDITPPKLLPTIETARLRIRPFTLDDVDVYHAAIHSDADVMRYLPAGHPLPRIDTIRILNYFIDHGEQQGYSFEALTDKASGTLIGHVGLHYVVDAVEVGYALGKQHWGNGYATEAALAMMRYGFTTHDFESIIALAFGANTASRRVMERIGMTFEGYTERYYDTRLVKYRITKTHFERLHTVN
ncbi:MAG: GNAT family N-acetyltransferase [Chloroflexota bacterium]|nr:GNAT family N-acetyltransferase [Chloroflexota bacterium]